MICFQTKLPFWDNGKYFEVFLDNAGAMSNWLGPTGFEISEDPGFDVFDARMGFIQQELPQTNNHLVLPERSLGVWDKPWETLHLKDVARSDPGLNAFPQTLALQIQQSNDPSAENIGDRSLTSKNDQCERSAPSEVQVDHCRRSDADGLLIDQCKRSAPLGAGVQIDFCRRFNADGIPIDLCKRSAPKSAGGQIDFCHRLEAEEIPVDQRITQSGRSRAQYSYEALPLDYINRLASAADGGHMVNYIWNKMESYGEIVQNDGTYRRFFPVIKVHRSMTIISSGRPRRKRSKKTLSSADALSELGRSNLWQCPDDLYIVNPHLTISLHLDTVNHVEFMHSYEGHLMSFDYQRESCGLGFHPKIDKHARDEPELGTWILFYQESTVRITGPNGVRRWFCGQPGCMAANHGFYLIFGRRPDKVRHDRDFHMSVEDAMKWGFRVHCPVQGCNYSFIRERFYVMAKHLRSKHAASGLGDHLDHVPCAKTQDQHNRGTIENRHKARLVNHHDLEESDIRAVVPSDNTYENHMRPSRGRLTLPPYRQRGGTYANCPFQCPDVAHLPSDYVYRFARALWYPIDAERAHTDCSHEDERVGRT